MGAAVERTANVPVPVVETTLLELVRVVSEVTEDDREVVASARTHEVRRNETLSGISQRYYRTVNRWKEILAANKDVLDAPTKLRPGMVLRIP